LNFKMTYLSNVINLLWYIGLECNDVMIITNCINNKNEKKVDNIIIHRMWTLFK
jgi:hypothetical protein